tara:strand:- start:3977 stop:4162 length:186 start_codon:yes stop_codon:yes gene_type:complete
MELKKIKEKKEKTVSSFFKNYFAESSLHDLSRNNFKIKTTKFKNLATKKNKLSKKKLTKKK